MEQAAEQRGVVQNALLTYWQGEQEHHLQVGTKQWYAWLETASVFRFVAEEGTFTAHKAHSGSGRGGWYWRAYRRHQGRLWRCYLGKSEDLSLQRLRKAARQLSGKSQAGELDEASAPELALMEEEEALVLTKLSIPRLSMQHIPRPHLLSLLERAVATSRLTLVSAPAGSGKTTLLAEWSAAPGERPPVDVAATSAWSAEEAPGSLLAASASARSARGVSVARVSWLALESADDDVVRLLTYLVAALARLDARIGQQARVLLRAVQGNNVERVLTSLVNDLSAYLTQDAALILDDYHLITVPAAHQALLFLLEHMPQRLHLVLGTRADPPLPLARLRARGQLSEVRGEDLRFAPAEAAAFLREMGIELSADDLQRLELRAEGWIAGIQLLALALRGRASAAELLDAFAGSHRFLTDYLGDEVLQRQPAAMRTFLLRTSVLERLCGPLCDALTGRTDGQLMLAELRSTNLFLSALDDSEQWYRYHPLFAAALRELLQRQEQGVIVELYRRAGSWYEQQDLPFEAIEYALRAGDFAHAADLMEPLARALVRRGDLTTLRRWTERLPDAVLFTHPQLCLGEVWGCLFGGQDARMLELMGVLERYLRARQQEKASREWRELCGEFYIFEAVTALPFDDTEKTLERSQAALDVLPSDAYYQRNLAALCIALAISSAHRTSGDIAAAEKTLIQANAAHTGGGYHFLSMIALHDLAELYQAQGYLYKLKQHYEQLLTPPSNLSEMPTLLIFFMCTDYANLMYEWNRLDEAEKYLERILQAHDQGSQEDGMFALLLLSRAKISLARGCPDEAWQHLHKLEAMLNAGLVSPPMLENAQAQRAYLLLCLGQLEDALPWAQELRASQSSGEHERLNLEHFFLYTTLARVLIAQARAEGNPHNLPAIMNLLDPWRAFSEQRGYHGLLIEVLILKALALETSGNLQEALSLLDQALALAEPQGYRRTFVDEGEPMARLLAGLAAQPRRKGSASPEYIQSLLSTMESGTRQASAPTVSAVHQPSSGSHPAALVDPLTPREQEVLTLLASGNSNQEIADTLIIAPNTVKRHVKHILGKLGALNRVQAVVRARELSLI